MPSAEWTNVNQLMADRAVEAKPSMSNDPSIGLGGPPVPVLLLECADAMMVSDPATGRVFELQTELLIRRGFNRFPVEAPTPVPLAGWAVTQVPDGLELRDDAGMPWAFGRTAPDARWTAAADAAQRVLVLYGGWLGVCTPRAVRESQYGPRQRAAELRVGRSLDLVAAAVVAWRPRSTVSPRVRREALGRSG